MTDTNADTRCTGCFADKGSTRNNPCPHCGFDETAARPPNALPLRSVLNGQFIVGRVLGKPGGFGITYLAFDQHLQATVAVKEYLPRDLAVRATGGSTILPQSTEEGTLFRYGLEQFLTEARTLAQLNHPNIVRVRQFFEANGSAYLVMDYYQGLSLAEHLEHQPDGRMPEKQAIALMQPILDGLRAVHAKGFLHRDIKPQNIYLARTDSGGVNPILLDFGAARQAMGERSRSLSVVVSDGYAPFEQYHRKGKQGPWTDVYAVAAVLYRMLTGVTPPAATERIADDELKPTTSFGTSQPVSAAIDVAMAMDAAARPQTVQVFQRILMAGITAGAESRRPSPPTPPAAQARPAPIVPMPHKPSRQKPKRPADAAPRQSPRPQQSIARSRRAGAGNPSSSWVGWGVGFMAILVFGMTWLAVSNNRGGDRMEAVRQAEAARQAEATRQAEAARRAEAARQTEAIRQATKPEMVHIPVGSFLMGCQPGEAGCSDIEKPAHQVSVPAFELGKTEVSFAEWDVCVADGGCRHTPEDQGWGWDDRPVIYVSWNDAQEYVRWLSRKTGKAYRLPTEAEWEYAARAGTTTAFSTGRCITTRQANYNGRYVDYNDCGAKTGVYLKETKPVGNYPSNPWGLADMHGNVWEWTQDCWNDSYRGAPTDGDAWTSGDCARRVLRGGSWDNTPGDLRSGIRGRIGTGYRYHNLGFRVARTPTP